MSLGVFLALKVRLKTGQLLEGVSFGQAPKPDKDSEAANKAADIAAVVGALAELAAKHAGVSVNTTHDDIVSMTLSADISTIIPGFTTMKIERTTVVKDYLITEDSIRLRAEKDGIQGIVLVQQGRLKNIFMKGESYVCRGATCHSRLVGLIEQSVDFLDVKRLANGGSEAVVRQFVF